MIKTLWNRTIGLYIKKRRLRKLLIGWGLPPEVVKKATFEQLYSMGILWLATNTSIKDR
jgi:hypothetical protein